MAQPYEEAALADSFGGYPQLNSVVGVARGEQPGPVDPRLAGMPIPQLAQLDRFSQGAQMGKTSGIMGLPGAAISSLAYELLGKNRPIGSFLEAAFGPQFHVGEKTSPVSLGNVRALLRGYMTGMQS